MDIAGFLQARLDEDETAALAWAADQREWQYVGQRNVPYGNGRYGRFAAVDVSNRPTDFWERIQVRGARAELAEHVVRWDPARVLAEITAKRRTLARHSRCGSGVGWCDDGGHGIEPDEGPGGCNDLLDLAAPYADHPDYDPAWRLEDVTENTSGGA